MPDQDGPYTNHQPPPWWPALIIAAVFAICLAAIGYAMHGKPLAEKTLTTLMMPVGMFWVVLTGRLLQLLVRPSRGGIMPVLLLWCALMAFGTRPLPRWLTSSIESSVKSYEPQRDGPLDAIVVLGGGTTQGRWRPQVGGSGDRLVLAAELYHLGMTKLLVTTGDITEGVSDHSPDPSEQTVEIWTKLGIDSAAIRSIGGRNTFEEMQQVKEIWSELPGKKVGLLTSALHLPRAVRLARSQGLEMTPIAADVRTALNEWGLLSFIPNAESFGDLARAQHEIMAAWVGR